MSLGESRRVFCAVFFLGGARNKPESDPFSSVFFRFKVSLAGISHMLMHFCPISFVLLTNHVFFVGLMFSRSFEGFKRRKGVVLLMAMMMFG